MRPIENRFSIRELAQQNMVYDPKTNSWQESPNEGIFSKQFWKYFGETRVLAQYDEDEDEINDLGEVIHHKKGDYKLNPQGLYYYENLNGRDIYGRTVLSKFDTLTTDGSFANKFDFFDADDKDKSVGGSLVRATMKVVPAFIPGVAPWYIGARVVLSLGDLVPKLGKMFGGRDNPTLSTIEGFAHTFDFSKSDEALNNTWSMENIIELSADVFTQLAEQRWLFQYLPSMLKGTKLGWDEATQKAFAEGVSSRKRQQMIASVRKEFESGRITKNQLDKNLAEIQSVSKVFGANALKAELDGFQRVGKELSIAYMTGVTVADAYSEALLSGASNTEAAIFTLGYAAAEMALLHTGLGEWILPELRMNEARTQQIIKSLIGNTPKEFGVDKLAKRAWYKKLFQSGQKLFKGEFNTIMEGSSTGTFLKHTFANSLGEGVEEVSEELLLDFSRSLFNAAAELRGDDTRLKAWENMGDRYALSFVGGFIGGGIGQALPNYRAAQQIKKINSESAWQELVYMVREKQGMDLIKTANKMTLGSKNLSPVDPIELEDGTVQYRPTDDKHRSYDEELKNHFKETVQAVEKILNAHGADLDDKTVLDHATLSDMRYTKLANSVLASKYLQQYNSDVADLIKIVGEINQINASRGDTKAK